MFSRTSRQRFARGGWCGVCYEGLSFYSTNLMNKSFFNIGAAVSVFAFGASALHASVIFSDQFSYTAASTLEGNGAWTGLNSGTAPTISSTSLSVSGLQASAGNKVSFASGNIKEAIAALGSTTSANTVFYSFAFQLSALPTATTYSFALSTGNTNYAAPVWLRADTGGVGYNIGLSNKSNSTANYSSSVTSLNTTVFIVGSYTFVTGTGNDTSSLWINPSSSTFGGSAPSASLTAVGGTDQADISQFLLRGAAGSPSGLFDELRVGTSWADVTPAAIPEPSTYAAILGGVALLGVAARRRRSV